LSPRPAPYRRWLQALVAAGVAWRIGRWAIAMPLWRDEANLGLNILLRSFRELTEPLDYFQVAPLLFLWAQKALFLTLGAGDLAVRLLPTLASAAALLLFARLAVRALPPLDAVIATGFLAASYYATRYGSEMKPYSLDLLAAVLLLALTLRVVEEPGDRRAGLLLVALTPLLIGSSYPALFVAVSAALLLSFRALRQRRLAPVAAGELLATGGAFFLFFVLATRGQERVTGPHMRDWWVDAFPPGQPWKLLLWLLDVHTGNLTAYPVGGRYYGSSATFLLMLIGAAVLWRRSRRLMALLSLPFALTLAAAALRRYPYGYSARVAQHLAPSICLLAGSGAAALLRRIASERWRAAVTRGLLSLLVAIAAAGLAMDVLQPYKIAADRQVREVVRHAFRRQPDRHVVVLGEPADVRYLWYLSASRGTTHLDPAGVPGDGTSVSALVFTRDEAVLDAFTERLLAKGVYARREDAVSELPLETQDVPPTYCRSVFWTREKP